MNRNTLIATASCLLFVGMFGLVLTELLINLTPPISRDALVHHLAIPKLWVQNGGFYDIPWATFSYYPMNLDLLYFVCLYFGNDILPKFIHLAFGWATAFLVYSYLKKKLSTHWGLLGALIFLSTPAIIRLSCSAYVDLGLVFFTSASVFAFIQWRHDRYEKVIWLIVSAACMGLAVGTKYNALIAWLFMNLMVVFFWSRDRGTSLAAIKYGILFFAVSFIIASPWYVKNYFLTSNPFYPLFGGFFSPSNQGGVTGGTIGAGVFHTRTALYGEQLWEILLIPLRMFFQGQDNSDQFFDGKLNPILILTVPLAFIRKDDRRDNLLFLFFSLFLVVVALFHAVPRVRYIAPVIPFLTILSIMGIKELVDKCENLKHPFRNPALVAVFAYVILFVFPNGLYLADLFKSIRPIPFVLNHETREDFLTRHIPSYPAMQFVNKNLPGDAKVFLVFLGRRGYYLDKAYVHESGYGMKTLRRLVRASKSEEAFVSHMRSLQCTHMLIRMDLFNKFLQDNYQDEERARFSALTQRLWRPVFEANGYAVLDVGDLRPTELTFFQKHDKQKNGKTLAL